MLTDDDAMDAPALAPDVAAAADLAELVDEDIEEAGEVILCMLY